MKRRNRCAGLLALALILGTLLPAPFARAATDGMVRVCLTSMGTPSSLAITIGGEYGIYGREDIPVQNGKTYTISVSGSQILWDGVALGNSFQLKKYTSASGSNAGTLSFYNAKYGTRAYLGDFTFSVVNGGIRAINKLYLEEYLYGVVPHEMSNAFPLEAQKVQAICARSYALKRMLARGSSYDLVDTSNDQVYKGYVASYANSIAAVDATRGMVLTSGGSIIDAYYSSSNGGQTDLPGNVWTSTAASAPYAMQDDPYDLANASSLVSSAVINRDGSGLSVSLDTLLRTLALSQVNAAFYMADINHIGIVGFDNIYLTDPRAIDPRTQNSRYYTNIVFQARMALTRYDGGLDTVPMTLTASLHSQIKQALFPTDDLRLYSLLSNDTQFILEVRRWGHGVGMSQRGAQQMANSGLGSGQILSFYFPGAQQTYYELTSTTNGTKPTGTAPTGDPVIPADPTAPVDPVTPAASGTGAIAGYGVVSMSSDASTLTVRDGPGTNYVKVGALRNGESLTLYDQGTNGWYAISGGGLQGYVSAQYVRLTSSGTPEQMPNTPTGTPITDPGAGPSGTQVPDPGSAGQTDPSGAGTTDPSGAGQTDPSGTGATPWGTPIENPYAEQGEPTAPPPDPTSGEGEAQTAVLPATESEKIVGLGMVKVPGGGTVNLRKGPGTNTDRVISMGPGYLLDIYGRTGNWLSVAYNGTRGYISVDYVLLLEGDSSLVKVKTETKASSGGSSEKAASGTATGRAKVKLENTSATVTIRESAGTEYKSLGTLKHGVIVKVLDKGKEWTKIQFSSVVGYVATRYLSFEEASATSASSAGSASSGKAGEIRVGSGKVNIRKGDSETSAILGSLPDGTKITVLDRGTQWTKIQYTDIVGYVMTKYVK